MSLLTGAVGEHHVVAIRHGKKYGLNKFYDIYLRCNMAAQLDQNFHSLSQALATQPSSRQPNVPNSQIFDEKTRLQGVIISAVTYGVNLAFFRSERLPGAKLEIKQDSRRPDNLSPDIVCLHDFSSQYFDHGVPRNFPGDRAPAAYDSEDLHFSCPIGELLRRLDPIQLTGT